MDNIKILKNYILYFLLMILVCLIGITDVLAWDWTNANGITYTAIGYVTNDTQIQIEVTYNTSSGAPLPVAVDQTVNTEIKTLYINLSNYNFLANTRYELELNLPNNKLVYANTYSVQGNNGEQCMISLSDSVFNDEYPRFDFQCPSATNSIAISVYNSNNTAITKSGIFSWHYSHLYSSTMSINSSTTNNNDLINNANQNADRIIDNQNQNTQDIINNQNQNSQNIQNTINNNFQTCNPSPNLFDENYYNNLSNYNTYGNVKYSLFKRNQEYKTYWFYASLKPGKSRLNRIMIYFSDSPGDSSTGTQQVVVFNGATQGGSKKIPGNIYFQIYDYNSTKYNIEKIFDTYNFWVSEDNITYVPFGEICINKLDDQTNAINGLNDSITDDDIDDATSEASDFFSDFNTNTFGLTSIITAPLNLIQSLTSSSCTSLHLPLPYLDNKYLDLPCMSSIYSQYFGSFFTLYQTITYGIIAYWVCVRIFNQVKDFKNPEHDEIEVVDL